MQLELLQSNEQTQKALPKLVPLSKWNNYYDFPSAGALRQYNFHNTNGFRDKVIRKIGKRLYINIQAFWDWADSNKR